MKFKLFYLSIWLIGFLALTDSIKSATFEDNFDPPDPRRWEEFDTGWFFTGGTYGHIDGNGANPGMTLIKDLSWADMEIESSFFWRKSSHQFTNIVFRYVDEDQYYLLRCGRESHEGKEKIQFSKRTPSGFRHLGEALLEDLIDVIDIKIIIQGTVFHAYYRNAGQGEKYKHILTVQDSDYASGRAGLHCSSWAAFTAEHYYECIKIVGTTEPTPTPTSANTPTKTPTPTQPPKPSSTPTARPTQTPVPTKTPIPTKTPVPTHTPTPHECLATGVEIWMPSHHFTHGDICACKLFVCNAEAKTLSGFPLFVILDVYGQYFFAPAFNEFDFYSYSYGPGKNTVVVIPEFIWPPNVGSADNIVWYSGITDPQITHIYGQLGTFTFGWSDQPANTPTPTPTPSANTFTPTPIWVITTIDSEEISSQGTSITLDNNGNPNIAYSSQNHGHFRDLNYIYWNNTSWVKNVVVDSSGASGIGGLDTRSLSLDSNNYPHIGYFTWYGGMYVDLSYSHFNGNNWQSEILYRLSIGITVPLQLDSLNYPHICSRDGDASKASLKYIYWDGISWQDETIEELGNRVGYATLSIDHHGFTHFVCSTNYPDYSMIYAYWDGNSWNLLNLNTKGIVLSLALDSFNYPHISALTPLGLELKYAHWNGNNWLVEIVDNEGETGFDSSIAVDSLNRPHISYCCKINEVL